MDKQNILESLGIVFLTIGIVAISVVGGILTLSVLVGIIFNLAHMWGWLGVDALNNMSLTRYLYLGCIVWFIVLAYNMVVRWANNRN